MNSTTRICNDWQELYQATATSRDVYLERCKMLLEALEQADLQIEYMQQKFKETGTGNSVRAQIQNAIRKAKGEL